jgi:hypothetical protein
MAKGLRRRSSPHRGPQDDEGVASEVYPVGDVAGRHASRPYSWGTEIFVNLKRL